MTDEPFERIRVLMVPHDPRSNDAPFMVKTLEQRQRDGTYLAVKEWREPNTPERWFR
jgi:hypothetical protein